MKHPGALLVAVVWSDWQARSNEFENLLTRSVPKNKEVLFVILYKLKGKYYSRCIYISIENGYAML